jgi:hypothetical protein
LKVTRPAASIFLDQAQRSPHLQPAFFFLDHVQLGGGMEGQSWMGKRHAHCFIYDGVVLGRLGCEHDLKGLAANRSSEAEQGEELSKKKKKGDLRSTYRPRSNGVAKP